MHSFSIYVAALIAGVSSHLLYFHHGEHHLHGVRYVQFFVAFFLTAVAMLVQYFDHTVLHAMGLVTILASSFFSGLYASLLIYRIYLHPLNKFPGPIGARASTLYLSTKLGKLDLYKKLVKLHGEHGDFVRVGSSDLSITHPKAPALIYGSASKCTKTCWYDLEHPKQSLQQRRDRASHDQRRRVWSPAFSDKALRGYEQRIQPYVDKLALQIGAHNGQKVNVSKWFNYFSFDVMGELAYGSSFGMLEKDEEHWAIKVLGEGLKPIGLMLPMWVFRLIQAIPGAMGDWWRYQRFCEEQCAKRQKMNPIVPDIMSTLLEPLKGKELTYDDRMTLEGDTNLVIVAGSDTTSTSLTFTFLELARHPEHVDKLRKELEAVISDPSGDIPHQNIINLDHLNGIIYESLRLYPPVPSAVQRLTPPEGLDIGGTFVPGNMTVYCPPYVMARKEKIFPQATTFIPERWYEKPELIQEKNCWFPFGMGPYGCIGKPLALMEMRKAIAKIVLNFDVEFAPDVSDRGKSFEEGMQDYFVVGLAELNLCFRRRGV